MRYLNSEEEQRLNEVLQRFSNSESTGKIDVRLGRTIAYRGIPGETPEIDRITPKQLENLEKVANNPEESKGVITVSRAQTYQVQNGQQTETNTLQPAPKNPSIKPSRQSHEANQIQASLAELKSQNEKQQAEMAQLRELMLEQRRLLQKVNTPVKERLGDWFNQVRGQVSDRIQEFSFNTRQRVEAFRIAAQERVEAVRVSTKQQVQSVASNAVSRIVQATGERQVDGSVLLQGNGQKFQAIPKLDVDNSKVSVQQQPKEVIQQVQQSQEKLNNSSNTVSKEQLNLEQLSQQQRERLFIVYARQQQQVELANLNQSEQVEFKRLVSETEQEYLIKLRAKELKEEYGKQQLNGNNNNKKEVPVTPPPLLTQEYLAFKKLENTGKEAEIKSAEQGFLGTKPPDSPHDFKAWYYAGTASEEFQISCGIIPPQKLTPSGAVWYSQLVADSKRIKAENLVDVEKERLKEAGFTPDQIKASENAIHKQAFTQVGEQWKQERAEALKAWQESKGVESFQKFNQQESQQPQSKEQVEVKVENLEKWRQEAQELGRSNNHLEKIDQIVNSAKNNTNDAASSVKINERDFKAMQRDRSEFNQQSQVRQTHTSVRGTGIR